MIQDYLNFDNGFYIEAGANDGVSQSNTLFLENRGWKGILIEPNKFKYQECINNRSKNNIVVNCALVSNTYTSSTITGSFFESSGESLCGQIIDDLEYCPCIQAKQAGLEKIKNKYISEVLARTLQSIINEYNMSKIDFMSLDVEGYEIPAMDGLDFNKNPPSFIRIETTTLSEVIEKYDGYLISKKYIFIERVSENDALYKFIG